MRYYTFLVALLFAGTITVPVIAQSTTPKVSPTVKASPTPTKSDIDAEVDKLKEKVAETVSELKGSTEKAIAGVVQTVNENSLVIMQNGDTYTIKLDDTLTQFYEVSGAATRDSQKDSIKKGDYIFILGPEISAEITANAVYKDVSYTVITGKITEVNSSDYTVNIISLDKTNYTLDIQTQTSQQMLNIKTMELERIGFSKLKEGDSIHAVIETNFENPKTTRYDAQRILIVPNEYFMQ